MIWRERVLLALNLAVLAGSITWAVVRLNPSPDASLPTPASSVPKGALVLPDARIDRIEALPLFHRSRQPPTSAEAALAASPAPALPAAATEPPILLGLAGSPVNPGALLEDPASSKRRLVYAGQRFETWTVISIRSRQVRLRDGDNTVELVLRPGSPQLQSGTSSPAVPP